MFALRRAAWAGARAVGAAASRATPVVSATSSSSLWLARAGVVRATAAASSAGVANFSTKKAPGGADIIDGKAIAKDIVNEVRASVEELRGKIGRQPGLAVVLVGARPDSAKYVEMKEKAAKDASFNSIKVNLDANVTQKELISIVNDLNSNKTVDGILVQLPLPDHIEQKRVLQAIDVVKDVDGFHPHNLGALAREGEVLRQARQSFQPELASNAPCTPLGCIELLQRSGVDVSGKHAVVLGRSNIVGLPVSLMLLHQNATVTVCHSRTDDIPAIVRSADIIIAAIGMAEFVQKDWVKPGAVVIDVGVNFVDDSTRKTGRRMCGDVEYKGVSAVASKITPVPGGVGPMTVAMLMRNTLVNWQRRARKEGLID